MGLLVFVIDIEFKPFGFEVLCKKSSKKRFCFVRAETEFKIKETSNMHIGHVLSHTGFKYELNIDILSYKTRQPNVPSPAKHLLPSTPLACNPFQCWLGPGSSYGKVTAILIYKFLLKSLYPGEGK